MRPGRGLGRGSLHLYRVIRKDDKEGDREASHVFVPPTCETSDQSFLRIADANAELDEGEFGVQEGGDLHRHLSGESSGLTWLDGS